MALFFILLAIAGCSPDKSAESADTYTCPMHPTVISDRPGTCPVCGMDLVRKARPGEEVKITDELARLIKSPNEVISADINTVKAEFKSTSFSLVSTGVVSYDTRQIHSIPSRIGGRLEKVYLKYSFQPIQKGQKIAEIYSPDLLTAQRELIYLLEHDPENQPLVYAAKNKLLLMGATDKQVATIAATREAIGTFPIYSAQAGYIVASTQQAPSATAQPASSGSSGMDGMGASTLKKASSIAVAGNQSPSELIREGSYVTAGETLFSVVSKTAMWIELRLPVSQSGTVSRGDEVEVELGNGATLKSKIDFVQPFFSDGEEFVKARVYANDDNLRIGQLVKATITRTTKETYWLPKQAVIDLGNEKIVFVKEREMFKPKKIVTGVETGSSIEVLQGLVSSDEVAVNAQYIVDSESFIKSK